MFVVGYACSPRLGYIYIYIKGLFALIILKINMQMTRRLPSQTTCHLRAQIPTTIVVARKLGLHLFW
jgi:hypothetical protein